MSFLDQANHKTADVDESFVEASELWSEATLRAELQRREIWTARLPGNVECWHKEILPLVKDGSFTFEEFADALKIEPHFDFGSALRKLHNTKNGFAGGWLEGEPS